MWPQPDWVRIADLFVQNLIQFAFAATLAVITGAIGYQLGIRTEKSKQRMLDESTKEKQALEVEAKSKQQIHDQLLAGLDDPARELQKARWLQTLKNGEKLFYILAVAVISTSALIGLLKGQSGDGGILHGGELGRLSYVSVASALISIIVLGVAIYVLSSHARQARCRTIINSSLRNLLSFLRLR